VSKSKLAIVFLGSLIGIGIAAKLLFTQADPRTPQEAPPALAAEAVAESFGDAGAFGVELKRLGQLTPQDFARHYTSKADYLPQLSWDPTTATFWDQFNVDPATKRDKVRPGAMYDDYRLNPEELALFKKNGFVVSERLGGQSFADVFYRIYSRDLPVYVSSDAILHAWHRSYDAILADVEQTFLAPSLAQILDGMASALPDAQRAYGTGVLTDSVLDADYFLATARSFLAGRAVATHLDQDPRVAATLRACAELQLQKFPLFGRDRQTDFSQFKVRGHYEKTKLLQNYFRAMMWCGRIDLRVAGKPEHASPRELGAAVVLHDLLRRSGKFELWKQFDRLLQVFVGPADSMTFAQLGDVLITAGIQSPSVIKDLDTLAGLQAEILAGKVGLQQIRGDVYESPYGLQKVDLPRSFTVLGQKFVLDSWALSKVVYDDILWDGEKVPRRVPSCLDVAFAVLGNDQVVPDLVARMTNPNGRKFRDGLNYQHNLAAVRSTIDAQKELIWEDNLYTNWLACLRELSAPTSEAKYPEAMRTQAWAKKTLSTQLASWTQLRHDTILYAKPSYSSIMCFYPAGYVEPVPAFWARLEKMATRAAELLRQVPFQGELLRQVPVQGDKKTPEAFLEWNPVSPANRRGLQGEKKTPVPFLRNFARRVAILKTIADKELAQKELSQEELTFLKEIIEGQRRASGLPRYSGWYPGLFYEGPSDSGAADALVADVHTDPPGNGDPGCVLHEGVGNVDLLMIGIDSGKDRMVFAGPVLSHYEFDMPGISRKSDSEWVRDVVTGKKPARPDWTQGYLVPSNGPPHGRMDQFIH
jgi:hypothetical protein